MLQELILILDITDNLVFKLIFAQFLFQFVYINFILGSKFSVGKMFIKVFSVKGTKPIEVSKKQLISELKELIEIHLDIEKEKQKLFYSGKLLEDKTPIYKYNIKDGHVVQLIEASDPIPESKVEKVKKSKNSRGVSEISLSMYYNLGDFIEYQEPDGSWVEGEITEIFQEGNNENTDDNTVNEPICIYKVVHKVDENTIEKELKLEEFRPRSIFNFDLTKLKIRQTLHLNYNIEQPQAWGKWYDFYIDEIKNRKNFSVTGHLLLCNGKKKDNITVQLLSQENSIFSIRNHVKISERDKNFDVGAKPIFCDNCQRNKSLKCRSCGCSICGGRNDPDKTIVCDECQWCFHIYCLKPPLKTIPEEDDWYCSECKNENELVKIGETVKTTRGAKADKSKSKRLYKSFSMYFTLI